MVRHIVCWKLRDRTPQNLESNLNDFAQRLYSLKDQISLIKYMEVGLNGKEAPEGNFDIVFIADFDGWKELANYQAHPSHLELVRWLQNVRELRSAVDFEM